MPRLAVAVVLVGLSGCQCGRADLSNVTPVSVELTAADTVRDDGLPINVVAELRVSRGVGEGEVRFFSSAGLLSQRLVVADGGIARVQLSCSRSSDSRCVGEVEVLAEWEGLSASRRVQVIPVAQVDGGREDAGLEDGGGEDAGLEDAGSDSGVETGVPPSGGVTVAPGDVYLVGPLVGSYSVRVAVNLTRDAGDVFVLPQALSDVRVRGSQVTYLGQGQIRDAVRDPVSAVLASNPEQNDVALPTACPPGLLFTSPDLRYGYACGPLLQDLYEGTALVSTGVHAAILTATGFVFAPMVPPPMTNASVLFRSLRNSDAGVYVPTWSVDQSRFFLWEQVGSGPARYVGAYATLPATMMNPAATNPTRVVLGGDLALYVGLAETGEVWRLPFTPDTAQLVYTTPTELSDPFAVPPRLNVKVDVSSFLVTSP